MHVYSATTRPGKLNAGDDDMPYRVVRRMKALLLEAQVQQAKAEADHRIAAAEAAALASKIGYAFALHMHLMQR